MATSYTNPGGSGDRTATVTVTAESLTLALMGPISNLVNGNLTENQQYFAGGGLACWIKFQFPSAKVIDEAKFYQSNGTAHGTWKWQGSNDNSAWTDIGGTFTLGGTTTQTHTTLAGNTTAYTYYRIFQTGGTTSSSPWMYEFEFKIDSLPSSGITHVASITAAPNQPGGTSGSLNTTGANLLIVSVSWYAGAAATITVSDNKGNTWTALTTRSDGSTRAHRFWYAKNATVGTGHQFTVFAGGVNFYPAFIVHAFAGAHATAPFDVENGSAGTTGNSRQPGSITPTQPGALVISGFCGDNVSGIAVDSGLTQTTHNYFTGNNMAAATGYAVQGTASAINPTWTWSGTAGGAVSLASFLPSAAAAGPDARLSQLTVETLSLPSAPARTSQLAIEVLGSSVASTAPGQITQLAVETLQLIPIPAAQLTQLAVETLQPLPPIAVRATQFFAEVFRPIVAPARATQLAIEIFHPRLIAARSTQTVVEYFQGRSARAQASQVVVEIFRTVVDEPCPVDFPIDTDGFPLE